MRFASFTEKLAFTQPLLAARLVLLVEVHAVHAVPPRLQPAVNNMMRMLTGLGPKLLRLMLSWSIPATT